MKVWRRFRRLLPTRGRISRWAGPASPRSWNDFWKGKIAELASGVGVNLRPQFQSSFVVLLKNERQKMSTQTLTAEMKRPKVVLPQEWEVTRQQLPVKEKELTRARDAVAAERR